MVTEEVIVLGIESTAHTFGVGIASSKGEILSDIREIYKPDKGGIHPREAAEFFSKVAPRALTESLKEAGLKVRDLDGIAVALGPGLGPCLRIGASIARALSLKYGKPLIAVNHGVAHIEIGRLTARLYDPLVIYISGGNTLIAAFVEGCYRIFGETLDIALGNCIDVFAREIGLGFPGGRLVDELAERGRKYVELPYIVKGQDLSFSGILTAALRVIKEGANVEDVAFSFVETLYSMVAEVAERGLVHTGKTEVLLVGGVAKSKLLREKLKKMVKSHGAKFGFVNPKYAGDNGVMIAFTGALALKAGVTIGVEESVIRPKWRVDEVEVPWFHLIRDLVR
ncbi:MAG: UGMP family protein [Thermoprotei archaeon]|nr:MAG: UGMP family protein [Thermoprotei archaeon]RLE81425.1 MAG: UGMP family protein [Thermoprotei archaeon]